MWPIWLHDLIIIASSILIWFAFALFFADKLFKFYIGIIIGFLLFIAFNCQIDVLENLYGRELSGWQNFLVKNKDIILNVLWLLVPVLWILFALNPFKKWGFFPSLLLGSMLPLFLLGALWYIAANSVVDIPLLDSVLDLLKNSSLLAFLRDNSHYIFLALLFLIFYKAIFALLWAFALWLWNTIRTALFGEWNRHWDDEEVVYEDDEEEYEDEDEVDEWEGY